MNLKKPFRILTQENTISGQTEVYKMPYSNCLYSITYINKNWRVQEVYIQNETIYTKYNFAYKDFDSLIDAYNMIEENNEIDYLMFSSSEEVLI